MGSSRSPCQVRLVGARQPVQGGLKRSVQGTWDRPKSWVGAGSGEIQGPVRGEEPQARGVGPRQRRQRQLGPYPTVDRRWAGGGQAELSQRHPTGPVLTAEARESPQESQALVSTP